MADHAPDPILVLFSQRIIRERTTRGWTRAELGRRSGVPADCLRSYENSAKQPGVLNALGIARALGIPLDDLLAGQVCATCDGRPGPGFICGVCGRSSTAAASGDGDR